jgi:hypothetical protein
VKDLLEEFKDYFEDPLKQPGKLKNAEATIPLISRAQPIYHKEYR